MAQQATRDQSNAAGSRHIRRVEKKCVGGEQVEEKWAQVCLKWLGSNTVLAPAALVYVGNDVDYATVSTALQCVVAKLLVDEAVRTINVRATLSGPNNESLTLKPAVVCAYYKLAEKNDTISSTLELADAANATSVANGWTKLRSLVQQGKTVVVNISCYSAAESACALVNLDPENYFKLSAKERRTECVAVTWLKHQTLDPHVADIEDLNAALSTKAIAALDLSYCMWLVHWDLHHGNPRNLIVDEAIALRIMRAAVANTGHGDRFGLISRVCAILSSSPETYGCSAFELLVLQDIWNEHTSKPVDTYSRDEVLQRVKIHYRAFRLHPNFRHDRQVRQAAVESLKEWSKRSRLMVRLQAAPFLKDGMPATRRTVRAIAETGADLCGVPADMLDDFDVATSAVSANARNFHCLPQKMQNNASLVRVVVGKTGNRYFVDYAPPAMKRHRGVVLAACKANGALLKHADKMYADDKEVVLAACRSGSFNWSDFSPRLRKDTSVLRAALKASNQHFVTSEMISIDMAFNALRWYIPFPWHLTEFTANNKRVVTFEKSKSDLLKIARRNPGVLEELVREQQTNPSGVHYEVDSKLVLQCVRMNWRVAKGQTAKRFVEYGELSQKELVAAVVSSFGAAKAAAARFLNTSTLAILTLKPSKPTDLT